MNKLQELKQTFEDETGLRIKELMLLISVAYAGILSMPFVIEALGLISAAVGMATQSVFYIVAQKSHGRNLAETLVKSGFSGCMVFFGVTASMFFSLCQVLTLTGVVQKGTLVIW